MSLLKDLNEQLRDQNPGASLTIHFPGATQMSREDLQEIASAIEDYLQEYHDSVGLDSTVGDVLGRHVHVTP